MSGYARPTIEILFGADGASDRIVLTIAADRVPAPGLYEITGYSSEPVEGKCVGAYASSSNTVRGSFLAIGGEARIIQSRNNRLRGTVTLHADGLPEGSNTALFLEFSGSLDALDMSTVAIATGESHMPRNALRALLSLFAASGSLAACSGEPHTSPLEPVASVSLAPASRELTF